MKGWSQVGREGQGRTACHETTKFSTPSRHSTGIGMRSYHTSTLSARNDMTWSTMKYDKYNQFHIYFTGSRKFIFWICRYRGFATQDGFENLRLRNCLPLSCPLAIQNSSLRNPSFQISNFPSRNRSLWQSKRLHTSSKLCHFAFELLTWQTR